MSRSFRARPTARLSDRLPGCAAPDVDTLLLAGMLANQSVWQAAREAADRGFGVVVVWIAAPARPSNGTTAPHRHRRRADPGTLLAAR